MPECGPNRINVGKHHGEHLETPPLHDQATDFDTPPPDDPHFSGILSLAIVAAISGVVTGFVGGSFRFLLAALTDYRGEMLHWARGHGFWHCTFAILLGVLAATMARFAVRLVPESSGSGVQQVEAHIRGDSPPAPPRVLPAKFFGALLSIGAAGLILGREGPTVQMGASIGGFFAKHFRMSLHDIRTVTCSLGGAGLGVAFNAPIGGSLFVFEEVAHAFRTRLVVATFIGTACALAVSRLINGGAPVLPVGLINPGPGWLLVGYALLGCVLGALGVFYNKLILGLLDAFVLFAPRLAPELKTAAIALLVMTVGIAAPWLIGGGDDLNSNILTGALGVTPIVVAIVVRWLLGPLSYSAGTPGGLFAPLLVLGAGFGALAGHLAGTFDPSLTSLVPSFAIVGMTSFFTGVVRAPVTAVVLIMEMTSQTSLAVPMVVAAAAAVIVATLLKGAPIYETLRQRLKSPE